MSDHKRRRGEDDEDREVMRSADVSDEQMEALNAITSEQTRAHLIIERETHKLLRPILDKRRKVLLEIPSFWPLAFKHHMDLFAHLQIDQDQDAMSYLRDVYLDRDETEPRAFTIEFHFDENPYFSDAVLKKGYQLYKHARAEADEPDADGITKAMLEFMWERDIKEQTVKINWKDDSKNLTKKFPRADQAGRKGDDDDNGAEMMIEDQYGSFFHFFEAVQTEEDADLAHLIADDLYADAPAYFAGQGQRSIFNNDSDESDDESEDDDDDASEIDLEKPRPKKRKI